MVPTNILTQEGMAEDDFHHLVFCLQEAPLLTVIINIDRFAVSRVVNTRILTDNPLPTFILSFVYHCYPLPAVSRVHYNVYEH